MPKTTCHLATGLDLREFAGEFPRGEVADRFPPATAQSGDQAATADRFGQRGEHRGLLEYVFGLPGHAEGLDGAPVARLNQAQPGEPGIPDHPGHGADVLRTPWPDENDVDVRHEGLPILEVPISTMSDRGPFHDLKPVGDRGAFSVPLRKWREILFVGAMRETEDGLYVRDRLAAPSSHAGARVLRRGETIPQRTAPRPEGGQSGSAESSDP